MLDRLRAYVSTPARQAAAWATLGIAGVALGVLGLALFLDGGSDSNNPRGALSDVSPTATQRPSPTPSPSPSASPSASPSPSETPTETATPTPQRQANTGGGGNPAPPPAPTPTPAPVAGGPYCNTISSSTPPNSVIGTLKVSGADAPAGTVVSLAFDGVVGPSRTTTAAGGYRVDWSAGGSDCANRVGAAISVIVNGQAFATGVAVGGNPFIRFDIDAP